MAWQHAQRATVGGHAVVVPQPCKFSRRVPHILKASWSQADLFLYNLALGRVCSYTVLATVFVFVWCDACFAAYVHAKQGELAAHERELFVVLQ